MEIFLIITQIAGCFTAIMTAIAIFVKPIRQRIFNSKKANDGEKCLLRCEILNIYYKGLEKREIHQYEAENLVKLYEAYKALGGNSFIEEVYSDIKEWRIIR